MLSLKNKAILFNFISFAVIYLLIRYLVIEFFGLTGILTVIITAFIAIVLAPKFMVTKTKEGAKLVLKWIFIKGFKTL